MLDFRANTDKWPAFLSDHSMFNGVLFSTEAQLMKAGHDGNSMERIQDPPRMNRDNGNASTGGGTSQDASSFESKYECNL